MKLRNKALIMALALSMPLMSISATKAQAEGVDTQSNFQVEESKERLKRAKARLDISKEQVNAAKIRLKAAEAEFKAAKANYEARTLDTQAQKLSENSGLPEIPEALIKQNTPKSIAAVYPEAKSAEKQEATAAPVVTPAETPDLSSTRLKQTDFNAQDLTPQAQAPANGQAPSQSMLEQPSIVP